MQFKKQFSPILAIALVYLLTGCVTTTSSIKFNSTDVPVSMSKALYDNDLNVLSESSYKKVGDFKFKKHKFGVASGLISINDRKALDLSNQINETVKAKGGNAMVKLKVSLRANPIIATLSGTVATFAGFWALVEGIEGNWGTVALAGALWTATPSYSVLVVKGDIVRVTDRDFIVNNANKLKEEGLIYVDVDNQETLTHVLVDEINKEIYSLNHKK